MVTRCWVICLDCGEREFIPCKWLDRRSTRCRACGGPIELSQATKNRLDKARHMTGSIAIREVKPRGVRHPQSHYFTK